MFVLAGAQSSAPGRQNETSPSRKLSRGGVGPPRSALSAAAAMRSAPPRLQTMIPTTTIQFRRRMQDTPSLAGPRERVGWQEVTLPGGGRRDGSAPSAPARHGKEPQ